MASDLWWLTLLLPTLLSLSLLFPAVFSLTLRPQTTSSLHGHLIREPQILLVVLQPHVSPPPPPPSPQDSTLLVTCSADKNIRIWGLDFGDCHKSLFAHDDSIMGVKVC